MTEKKPTKQWISFTLGSETYAHAIASVREIIHYVPPVPVPGAPPEVEGVLNVRGDVVPILCGHTLLNLPTEAVDDDDWRVIILETPAGLLGLRVDAINEIVTFPDADIEANTSIAPTSRIAKGVTIKGTYQHQQDLLIPIDLTNYGNNARTTPAETTPEATPISAFPDPTASPATK